MKKVLCFASVSLFISCSIQKPTSMIPEFASNPVIAHRGAFQAKGYPENSIAALEEAIRLKCTGSEFDVRMTADDSLVVNHDPHYKGMDIEKTSYNKLAAQLLPNGEPLPTLRRYLQTGLVNNSQTRLVLEIKPSPAGKAHGQKIAARCVEMVKELGAAPMTIYISFDYDMLKKVKEVDPQAITQYLNGDKSPDELKADGISGLDYHFSVFKQKPEWIATAKKNNLILNAWTVNSAEDMKWFLANGFDFITTNEPELLLNIVGKGK